MECVNIIIECEHEREETEIHAFEEKENSVIVMISTRYSNMFEENELKFKKQPVIYFGKRLVKEYVRLPYENVYEDDEDWGKICLFPKAKYEFMFYPK
jgi:hypothetical protein